MDKRLCPGCGKPAVYNPLERVLTIMMDFSGRIWHKACAQQILAKFQEPESQLGPVRDLQKDRYTADVLALVDKALYAALSSLKPGMPADLWTLHEIGIRKAREVLQEGGKRDDN